MNWTVFSVKMRILKVLMEHQFDCPDFKIVTESLPSESLRHPAEGRDLSGKQYWTQIDHVADIRYCLEHRGVTLTSHFTECTPRPLTTSTGTWWWRAGRVWSTSSAP